MNTMMTPSDWLQLAGHFASLSLLGVGGAITTTPEMQRFLVLQQHWLSQEQFSSSIALAQAAPGPNILFIALMGWNVGLNAAGGMGAGATAWWLALLGMTLAMLGSLLPSCTLNYLATRWAHRNQHLLAVRAFKTGMAPVVIGLLISIGWLLTCNGSSAAIGFNGRLPVEQPEAQPDLDRQGCTIRPTTAAVRPSALFARATQESGPANSAGY